MPYLICIVPVAPVRREPLHQSEQTSQLLFGDVAEIVEAGKDFVKVKYLYDDYEGWCQRSQLEEISVEQFTGIPALLSAGYTNEALVNGKSMYIPMGCPISTMSKRAQVFGNVSLEYKGDCFDPSVTKDPADTISTTAMKFLNTAYLWGGRSVFGVDCSGFTQTVYRFAGIPLLRDAYQQASQGEAIGFLQEARCGDLAFFDNNEQRITHVGILLDPSTIVHASGKVRIDFIDHQGIINNDTGLRTHKLRVVKRIL
jgi:cell wall-associated NlpC family hydrolase